MSKNILIDVIGRLGVWRSQEKKSNANLDPRVIKVEYPNPNYDLSDNGFRKALFTGREGEMSGCQVLEEARFGPIVTDIISRFGDREIGMRGIMTSLDGEIDIAGGENNKLTVTDLSSLLADGCEKPGAKVINIAPLGAANQIREIPYRVVQYFYSCIKHDIVSQDQTTRDKLFPAIVVYDLSQSSPLSQLPKDGYAQQLPENPDDRKKIILGVYPVDVRFMMPDVDNKQLL